MKYEELKDKRILITGGTQGIGEAMAESFSAEKSKVFINGRKLNDKVRKVMEKTGAEAVCCDISDASAAEDAVRKAAGDEERIDVLVCNAAGMNMAPFLESDMENWWSQIKINLSGHIACIKAAVPFMKKCGGTIIIISSFFGTIGWKNATGYGASKSGLFTLGQYLAAKYAEENTDIKVCTIIPGVIDTAQLNVDAEDLGITLDEVRAMYADDIAMGRIARPGEIAETALYMASDAGRKAFNGRFVTVSGGEYRVTPYYV